MIFNSNHVCHKHMFAEVVEAEIRHLYKDVRDGHGVDHIIGVTNAMMYLAEEMGMDPKKAALIGAYHDIGVIIGDRENHHIYSRYWVLNNMHHITKEYDITFSDVVDIAEAVYEHRSSMVQKSSLWSMMISDADKLPTHTAEEIVKRAWTYTVDHYPELDFEEKINMVYEHVSKKYGLPNQYGNKFYLPISNMLAGDENIITVMNSKDMVSKIIKNINKEVK